MNRVKAITVQELIYILKFMLDLEGIDGGVPVIFPDGLPLLRVSHDRSDGVDFIVLSDVGEEDATDSLSIMH